MTLLLHLVVAPPARQIDLDAEPMLVADSRTATVHQHVRFHGAPHHPRLVVGSVKVTHPSETSLTTRTSIAGLLCSTTAPLPCEPAS